MGATTRTQGTLGSWNYVSTNSIPGTVRKILLPFDHGLEGAGFSILGLALGRSTVRSRVACNLQFNAKDAVRSAMPPRFASSWRPRKFLESNCVCRRGHLAMIVLKYLCEDLYAGQKAGCHTAFSFRTAGSSSPDGRSLCSIQAIPVVDPFAGHRERDHLVRGQLRRRCE